MLVRLVEFNQEFRPFDPDHPYEGNPMRATAAESAPFNLKEIGQGLVSTRAVTHDTEDPMMIDLSKGSAKVVPFNNRLGAILIEIDLNVPNITTNLNIGPNIGCRLLIESLVFSSRSKILEDICVFYSFAYEGEKPKDLIIPTSALEKIRLVFEDNR